MNWPRLLRDWKNPTWQPKFFGGTRMPRRLKTQFKAYGFAAVNEQMFPKRWLRGTFVAIKCPVIHIDEPGGDPCLMCGWAPYCPCPECAPVAAVSP